MFLLKRSSGKYPLIDHYGVLVTGDFVRDLGINTSAPVIIHQTYPTVRVDWADSSGNWDMMGEVLPPHVPFAIERVSMALSNPNYDLFANNCEQFARFVTTGQKTSTQLWAWGFGTALALFLVYASQKDN
jgi:hypothetical protein